MSVGSRLLMMGSLALGLLALLALSRSFWPFTVDDTFITLRYARHLAAGLGPVWNPGGPPAEGYTTVAWMALLALPHLLGLDALVVAKAGGIACTFGSLLLAARLSFELTESLHAGARRVATLFPFAFVAAYWPLALHAISGMETALAGLFVTAFVLASARYGRAPSESRARALALLALACTLTRPECALLCATTLVAQCLLMGRARDRSTGGEAAPGPTPPQASLRAWRASPSAAISAARGEVTPAGRCERRRFAWLLLGYCVLPGALYFLARYLYFGLLFPLPFYVKATGHARFAGLHEVVLFLRPFVWPMPHLGVLAVYGGLRQRALYPALLGLGALALFFVFPAHIMGFESRYLQPLVPTLSALMGAGVGKLASRLLGSGRVRSTYPVELALMLSTWLLVAPFRFPLHEGEARTRWLAYGRGLRRAHIALAETLRDARDGAQRPTIALLDVGAVAYYSEWFTIDTYGLNDAQVALSRRTDVDYVLAQQPELLTVVSEAAGAYRPLFDWELPLYQRAIAQGYGQVASYEFLPDYHLLVLARPASPLGELFARSRATSVLSDASH